MNNDKNNPTTMMMNCLEAKGGSSALKLLKSKESITAGLATMKSTYLPTQPKTNPWPS